MPPSLMLKGAKDMENKELKNAAANEDDIFTAAEKQDERLADTDVVTYTFKKPFTYEGKSYEKLTFDFGSLSGRDSAEIEAELRAQNHPIIVASLDGEYLIRVCVRACTENVGVDTLMALPLRDYNNLRDRARSFLMRQG